MIGFDNQIITASRLTCEHCHGHGYEDAAAGKVACGECNPQELSEAVSNHQEISCLSHGQSLLNILHREEDCSAFRKLVRVLNGNFARAANPFPAAANHIASAPATITDWDGKRRNCVVTERYDLQHFGLRSLGIGKEFLLLLINQHGKEFVRLHQTWCDWEMSGEQE